MGKKFWMVLLVLVSWQAAVSMPGTGMPFPFLKRTGICRIYRICMKRKRKRSRQSISFERILEQRKPGLSILFLIQEIMCIFILTDCRTEL